MADLNPAAPERVLSPPQGRPRAAHQQVFFTALKVAPFLVIIAAWQISSAHGLLEPVFFSSPGAVLAQTFEWYVSGRILPHLFATVLEVAVGLGLAIVFGLILGILIGRYEIVRKTLNPLLALLFAVPVVALGPVLSLVIGTGFAVPILLVFALSLFPIVFAVEAGIRTAPADLRRMAYHFGASELQLIGTVLVPVAVPYLVAGVRVSIGRAVAGAVVGEWLSSTQGLGAQIFSSASTFATSTVYAMALTIILFSLLLNRLVDFADGRVSAWRPR